MNIINGIKTSLQKRHRIYSYKIKHFGEPQVITAGISNFCVEGKWHLFYDYDEQLNKYYKAYMHSMVGGSAHLIETKHGIQIIDLACRELSQVKGTFDLLKDSFPSDYFWSIPLYLRITEKIDENGIVLSPAPINLIPKEILLNHFPNRKLYRTWD